MQGERLLAEGPSGGDDHDLETLHRTELTLAPLLPFLLQMFPSLGARPARPTSMLPAASEGRS